MKARSAFFPLILTLVSLLGACKTPVALKVQASPVPIVATVKVGALLDLSGSYADGAQAVKAGLEVALEDLNKRPGSPPFELVIKDAATDPEVALAKLKELDAQGIKLVVGPTTSADFAAVKDYALNHDILMLSPSTTAPSLALVDNVIRFSPVDTLQTRALFELWYSRGIKAVSVLYRDDVWGRDFEKEIEQCAEIYSMRYLGGEKYATNATDFKNSLARLGDKVKPAIAEFGNDKVAVELVSFNELENIFPQAAADAALSSIKWYGCSGNALIPVLAADNPASRFAASNGFTCSNFLNSFDAGDTSATRSLLIPDQASLKSRIDQKLNRNPVEYAYTAYDALWIAALAYEKGGFGDFKALKENLFLVSGEFVGASGKVQLNSQGDRSSACFAFSKVISSQGNHSWQRTATYNDSVDPQSDNRLTFVNP